MSTDDVEYSYKATSHDTGRPYGFYTETTTLDYGANLRGNVCGVYAEALEKPNGVHGSSQDESRPGVWGVGDHYGVYGASNSLYDPSQDPAVDHTPVLSPDIATQVDQYGGIGVVGASLKLPGVLGTSALTVAEVSSQNVGTGIVGDIVKTPAGVTGISGSTHTFGNPPFNEPVSGCAGVLGMSVRDVPNLNLQLDLGVKSLLESRTQGSGVGVFGWSFKGRGGVFASAFPITEPFPSQSQNDVAAAQIRLVPAPVTTADVKTEALASVSSPKLPRDGQAGDLIAVNVGTPGIERGNQTRLWFCVQSGSGDNTMPAAKWAQVLLSAMISGTR